MAYLDADMQFFIYVKNSRNKGKLFHSKNALEIFI